MEQIHFFLRARSVVIFPVKFRCRKVCADGIWIDMIEWCSDVCVCVRVLCASASCKRNDLTSHMQLSSCTNTVGGGRFKESHHFRTSTLTHRVPVPVYLSACVCDRMCACRNGPQETKHVIQSADCRVFSVHRTQYCHFSSLLAFVRWAMLASAQSYFVHSAQRRVSNLVDSIECRLSRVRISGGR